MEESVNSRCTIYGKVTNSEHKDLLEVSSHSGIPVTRIVRDATLEYVSAYKSNNGLPESPMKAIDVAYHAALEVGRAKKKLKVIKDSGVGGTFFAEELGESAGVSVEFQDEEESPQTRHLCRSFLQGLLTGRDMKTTDILDIGRKHIFSNRQVQRSLSDVGETYKQHGVNYWRLSE